MANKTYNKDLPTYQILINGSEISDTLGVQKIQVQTEINTIATATVSLLIENAYDENQASEVLELTEFEPGIDIEIKLGHHDNNETAFKGIIVGQRYQVTAKGALFKLNCTDKAIAMTRGKHDAIFSDKSYSNVFSELIDNHALAHSVDSIETSQAIIAQYRQTDWEFLIANAQLQNMTVLNAMNKLTITHNNLANAAANFMLTMGDNILQSDLNLDATALTEHVELRSWDPTDQQAIEVTKPMTSSLNQGNISATTLAKAIADSSNFETSVGHSIDSLAARGDAQIHAQQLSKIHGSATTFGNLQVSIGGYLELKGMGARFDGEAYVSKVTHTIAKGMWRTSYEIGKRYTETTSSSMHHGLQIAKVRAIAEDPQNEFRVLIVLPTAEGDWQEGGLWARISMPSASVGHGLFMMPEIDDEVIIHFIDGNAASPVIIGSLYSSKRAPAETPDEENNIRSYRTRSGLELKFDDDQKSIELHSPAGNRIFLDEDNAVIQIEDEHDNKIIMNADGIAIESHSNLKLTAAGDVDIEGVNIHHKAQSEFKAEGSSNAELSSGATTNIKGAIVSIN